MPIHLVYFEDAAGQIILPPTSDVPAPAGWERREANTISEVEALERRLQRATADRYEQDAQRDFNTFEPARVQTRRNIMAAIESASTDQYTKDFLRAWCQLRDERRREYYKQQFRCREAYLEALHNDRPRTAEESGIAL